MKKLALAVAAACAAIAPAAFAEGEANTPWNPNYERRPDYQTNYNDREVRQRANIEAREYRDNDYRNYDDRARREDFARVIESRPLYDTAQARQQCWNNRNGRYEELSAEERTRIGKGAAIGAVAGGVLGHQFDHGTGTAAGAVIGGLLGHQIEKRNDRNDNADFDLSRCQMVADSAPLQGYDVRYEYRGREYTTRMDHDPGRRLRVGQDIRVDGTPNDAVSYNNAPQYDNRNYNWR